MTQGIPSTLSGGRYEVGALIGHGGMAEVHLGTDTRLGRQVAIKIMRADLAKDAIFLSRFRREAHSVAMLNNPNIVSIYDTGEEVLTDSEGHQNSVPYLIMEYVHGQTLRDILKENGALSQSDTEQIIIGVLNALEYSHRMGIIHRDIKPGNIMISDQGAVKVMDFGIARALDDSAATMTQSQGVVGTALYLSPEQARGENVDMRSDLYSAGCVLYEILTGQPPYTGDSPVAIAYQHVSEVATPPSALVPGLPKIWDQVVAKAMAKDRQNRYATAAEFRHDILAVMNGGTVAASSFNPLTDLANLRTRKQQEEIAATRALPVDSSPTNQPTATTETTQAFSPVTAATAALPPEEEMSRAAQREAARQKRKKLTIIWSVVGVVVLAALIAGGLWFFGQRNKPQMATVPTVTAEMSETRAREVITNAGFVYQRETDNNSTQPQGTFTKQDPAGGTHAVAGSTVKVWFSAGPANAEIPQVDSLSQEEATAKLKEAGFTVSSVSSEHSATVAKNLVTRTDPASGTSQPKGSSVILYISDGQTNVPSVASMSAAQAEELLTKAGFTVVVQSQPSDTVPSGTAISTDPAAGATVDQHSKVTLNVSTGAQQGTVPSAFSHLNSLTASNACSFLQAAGFSLSNINISGGGTCANIPAGMGDNTLTALTGPDGHALTAGQKVNLSSTMTMTLAPTPDTPDTSGGSGDSGSTTGGGGSSSGSGDGGGTTPTPRH